MKLSRGSAPTVSYLSLDFFWGSSAALRAPREDIPKIRELCELLIAEARTPSQTVIAYENVGDIELEFYIKFGGWSVIKKQKEFKGLVGPPVRRADQP
jgi:hypothetical protein